LAFVQSGLLFVAGLLSVPGFRHVGAHGICLMWVYDIKTIRVVYPLFEHVNIFPVRLCLHSHWSHFVYLTIIIYLM